MKKAKLKKPNKGLSDKELITKYESGSINLNKTLQLILRK